MGKSAAEIVAIELFENTESSLPPEDFILQRIRELVGAEQLRPGARLPSERALAEKLNTTRGTIRKALQKLEFYGLVEISPQSGTRIAEMHTKTVEQLMESIPVSRDQKMADLLEARFILDVQCARLAAERRNDIDLELIEKRQEEFLACFYGSGDYLEEDYLFHLAIAHATGNHVLVSLFSQLTPRIVMQDQPHLKQKDKDFSRIPMEHVRIMEAIRRGDSDEAELAMVNHRNWALKRVFSGGEGDGGPRLSGES
jgi:GntR family transcriptional regulator, transcriptional repressor for pyruvate dehydrogenase complex